MNVFFLVIYTILSSLIFLKGLGSREVYDLSIFTFLALLLYKGRTLHQILLPLSLLIFHVIIPGISLLWGYCALMFSINKQTLHYAILCFLLWILEYFKIIPCSPWLITFYWGLFTILGFLQYKFKKWILIILSMLSVIFTIHTMPLWQAKMYAEKYVKSAYSPSDVFCKITNTTYLDSLQLNNDTKIIRSIPFYTKIPSSQPGILIFEINYDGEYDYVNPSVWQQPISWHDNQLIGNQYYLEAIRHDGGLYSNKGITLNNDKGFVQLVHR